MSSPTAPMVAVLVAPEPSPVRSPPTIEVVWSLRDKCWYARGMSWPGWRQMYGHHSANESDLALLHSAHSMFGHQETRGARLLKLPATYLLPKEGSRR